VARNSKSPARPPTRIGGHPAAYAAVPVVLMLVLAACSAATTSSPNVHSDDLTSHAMSDAPSSTTLEPTPTASEDPLAVCEGVEPVGEPMEITVGTASYSFDPRIIEGPKHCQPFVIVFTNSDPPLAAGGPTSTNEHNITIRAETLIGALLFDGELIGRTTIRYEVPGLPSGEHYMYCKVHPPMSGRIQVAPAGG